MRPRLGHQTVWDGSAIALIFGEMMNLRDLLVTCMHACKQICACMLDCIVMRCREACRQQTDQAYTSGISRGRRCIIKAELSLEAASNTWDLCYCMLPGIQNDSSRWSTCSIACLRLAAEEARWRSCQCVPGAHIPYPLIRRKLVAGIQNPDAQAGSLVALGSRRSCLSQQLHG